MKSFTKDTLRIVYMGTPDFAVAPLRALVEQGYCVVAVVTMPDKPIGRHGSVLQASPVKQFAVQYNIPVLQPENLKSEAFLTELRAFEADLQIVVAFRMLPQIVWSMPRWGTFNLHASLLPQYRGAAPINWAIINGDRESGVTTFFLTHEIDTGRIIRQRRHPIAHTDDAGTLHDALMNIGTELVVETTDLLIAAGGAVDTLSQESLYADDSELRPAPKLFKENCRVDWQQPSRRICNFVRGLSPYPAAWTEIVSDEGETYSLKIYRAEAIAEVHSLPIGQLRTDGKNILDVAVTDGFVRLHSIQLAGKKRLSVNEFLNGLRHRFLHVR